MTQTSDGLDDQFELPLEDDGNCENCGEDGYSCYCYLYEEEDNSLVPDTDGEALGL
jgi:hypothetical protein